jgi:hypothetical protein
MRDRAWRLVTPFALLFVACSGVEPPAENCRNGIDDDGDGAIDCDDGACAGEQACEVVAEDCFNVIDDDGDGAADCGDADCANQAACQTCNAQPDDCAGESICIGQQCEDAFNRFYTFSGIQVALGPQDAEGTDWDAFGGAPDPFVEIRLNDQLFLTTGSVDNTFSASYDNAEDVLVVAGSVLEVKVLDADVNAADVALTCAADPLSADFLRARGLFCEIPGVVSVSVAIDPN